jgi:hypothetical protein
MQHRLFVATGAAVALAVALGCGQTGSLVSPTGSPIGADAAADGSTLKATAPAPVSPAGGVRIDTLEPVFVLGTSAGLFTNAEFTYRIQVQRANGAVVAEADGLTPGDDGHAEWEIPFNLDLDSAYRWRGRAELGDAFGPWSSFANFLSLDYRGLVPRPEGGAWPTNGEDLVAYIAEVFPEYLVVTAFQDDRIANMEFLRDRIIEAGVCGGMDLARNLKRGTGPWSIDALAWRKDPGDSDDDVEVIDLANAYDEKTIPLQLHWLEVEGPPGYDPLPDHPGC